MNWLYIFKFLTCYVLDFLVSFPILTNIKGGRILDLPCWQFDNFRINVFFFSHLPFNHCNANQRSFFLFENFYLKVTLVHRNWNIVWKQKVNCCQIFDFNIKINELLYAISQRRTILESKCKGRVFRTASNIYGGAFFGNS